MLLSRCVAHIVPSDLALLRGPELVVALTSAEKITLAALEGMANNTIEPKALYLKRAKKVFSYNYFLSFKALFVACTKQFLYLYNLKFDFEKCFKNIYKHKNFADYKDYKTESDQGRTWDIS